MQLPQSGMILINKPVGPTSHDIVTDVRKLTGIKRVGHAGTLDPFAQGLLIILMSKEWTRRQSEFLGLSKTYEATIFLGATSNTEDRTGTITVYKNNSRIPSLKEIQKCLDSFLGSHAQIPPAFSAKKIQGTRAYKLARKGITPVLKPKEVTIHSIELLSYEWPRLTIRTHVSSGTYIRTLAREIGEHLECGGYCETLTRTAIGIYVLTDAISLTTSNPTT